VYGPPHSKKDSMCRTVTFFFLQSSLITYMWDRHETKRAVYYVQTVQTSERLRDAWMCVEVVVAKNKQSSLLRNACGGGVVLKSVKILCTLIQGCGSGMICFGSDSGSDF
jgi:hypothetical protein